MAMAVKAGTLAYSFIFAALLSVALSGCNQDQSNSVGITSGASSIPRGVSSAASVVTVSNPFFQIFPLPEATKQYQVIDTTYPLPAPEGYSISMSVAQEESEPTTFVLRATEALSGININVSSLTGPSGSILSASAIDIRLVKTWYQPSSGNCTCDVGKFLIPELLLKDDALVNTDLTQQKSFLRATVNGTTQYIDITTAGSLLPSGAIVQDAASLQAFSLPINTNKQVWMTVKPPAATPAGAYNGSITISVPGKPDTVMSLTVNVLPFTLAAPLVEQSISYRGTVQSSCSALDSDCKTQTQMLADLTNMRDHGISYPNVYEKFNNSTAMNTHLSLMAQVGLPKDKIYDVGDSLYTTLWGSNMTAIGANVQNAISFAQSRGWGQVYFFGMDEATGTIFESEMPTFQVIHDNGGKVFTTIPDAATATLRGIENIDMPVLYGYTMGADSITGWDAPGKNVFKYGGPFSGFQNSQYERLCYGLQMLARQYSGAMNYAYQDGGRAAGTDAWNAFGPNGTVTNHMYTYPATHGPIDTLQWEGHHEGTEDIRYVSTLASLNGWTKAQANTYAANLLVTYPSDAIAARQQVINDILAAQRKLQH